MPIDAPALGGIGDRVRKVPKLVWIVGGGIVLGFVVLKGKGGGGGAATVPAGLSTSGGGGGGGSDATQSTITGEDLAGFLADQAQSQADFQQSITDLIGGIQPPVTAPGGTPPTGGTGGTATPPPAPKIGTYKLSITGRTGLLSPALGKLGFGASGTYTATKIRVKGKDYFRFKRQGHWTLIPVTAKTIKVTPTK